MEVSKVTEQEIRLSGTSKLKEKLAEERLKLGVVEKT